MAARRQKGFEAPGFDLLLQWPRTKPAENGPHPIGNEDTLLRSALDNSADPAYCYTVRELTMLAWINELTDMPNWQRKIFDTEFTFRWKSAKLMIGHDVTRSMADWCVEEVQYYVHEYQSTRVIPALDGGIFKSDCCVDDTNKQKLGGAAARLRKRLKKQEPEVSIVDPHFFPFAWERTRTLRKGSVHAANYIARCGDGDIVQKPPDDDCKEPDHGRYRNDMAYSNRFQWLPFDVVFENGRSRIKSCINDVHPLHDFFLYNVAETLTDTFLPLFNRTIIDLKAPGYLNQRIHLVKFGRDPFIKRDPENFRPPEQRADESFLDENGRFRKSMFVDLKKEFWNIGLQMVLHMRDVDLSPQNPDYEGEDWHVQGQLNERIVASATFVYSMSNLSASQPPRSSFRCAVFTEEAMAAKGAVFSPPFLPEIYGAKHGDPAIQTMGNVTLREGRVVVWPNTFQTRLLPFSLDDRSKPGHCRMFTLHLVDPNRPNMSTSMVPCQRRDWWADAVRTSVPGFWRLPEEVFDMIVDRVEGCPISVEQGQRMRDDFLAERQAFRERHTQAMEEYDEWDFYGEPGAQGGSEEE